MILPPMEWIERIIRIPSVTDDSNEEIVRFLVPLLEETGLKVQEQKVVENGISFKNIIAFSHSPTSKNLLALNTHLDTVSPGDTSLWTKTGGNPFRATRVRDRIYGLGTADVKIDFLSKIWAARLAKPWNRPFVLVGTYGEERGLVGVNALFKEKKITPRFALVGEPSNLELIYAHKGHGVFRLSIDWQLNDEKAVTKTWKGKSAHSSTPDLGKNAIRMALNEILKRGYGIREIQGGSGSNKIPESCTASITQRKTKATDTLFAVLEHLDDLQDELKKRRDARFSPSFTTLSLNQIETVKGKVVITFDVRLLPDIHTERLKQKIHALEKFPGVKILDSAIDEPLRGLKNGKFITQAAEALKASGVKAVKKTKASCTEAAVYNQFGAEAIVFGPGISIGNVHKPNEYNSFRQIATATKFYTNMLRLKEEAIP